MDCNNNNHEPSGCWAGKQRLGVAERPLELLSSNRAVIGPAQSVWSLTGVRLQQQRDMAACHTTFIEIERTREGYRGCADHRRGLRCTWKGAKSGQYKELPGEVLFLAELATRSGAG